MDKLQLLMVAVFGILIAVAPARAQMHGEHEHKGSMMEHEDSMMMEDEPMIHHEDDESGPVKVGNKICPVSGEKVGQMGDPVEVEYNGKIYNLCCSMCKKDFLKNPEKYSKIAEDEVKEHGEEEGEDHESGHMEEGEHHHDHEHGHDHNE